MVLIGSPHFHTSGGKKGKSKGKGKSGVKWLTEVTVDGHKKQLCMRYQNGSCTVSGLQISSRMCIPQSRWHSVRTGTPSDATRINTTLTYEPAVQPSVAIAISDDEDNSVSDISPPAVAPQGNQPSLVQNRHPCSHRFILRSKGFHHPMTLHLIQFHHDPDRTQQPGPPASLNESSTPSKCDQKPDTCSLWRRGDHHQAT